MADKTTKNDLGLTEPMAKTYLADKKEMPKLDNKADGPLFQDIDGDQEVTEIESLCMNCHENGTTRLLLTRVPHFREVIIMAFDCPHCGHRTNELQQANAIAVGGAIYTCKVSSKADLNRQLVKTDTAVVKIPEVDFEIPAQRGHLTTVEGLLTTVIDDLSGDQPVRKYMDEALYTQIDGIIKKLQDLVDNKTPFTIILDDPAGNSYIESLDAPKLDDKLDLSVYLRTRAQERAMGLSVPEEEDGEVAEEVTTAPMPKDQQIEHAQQQLWEAGLTEADLDKERQARIKAGESEEEPLPEVLSFPANCSSCGAPSDTKMHVLDIPHFKEMIIMSTTCDECGYKSNEVKAGGPVSKFGKRIILKIEDAEDMSRDILKSETCGLSIPEIDLELNSGTLGGRFTTVEGLLRQVHDELSSKVPHENEDQPDRRRVFTKFLDKLEQVMSLEIKSTLILDDPLGNSYLQNLYAPEPDPAMTIEEYARTFEQNEALGLNDMRLEDYESGTHSEPEHHDHEHGLEAHQEELTDAQKEEEEISGTGVSGGATANGMRQSTPSQDGGSSSSHRQKLIAPKISSVTNGPLAIPVEHLLEPCSKTLDLLASLSTEQLDFMTEALQKAKELKAQNTDPVSDTPKVKGSGSATMTRQRRSKPSYVSKMPALPLAVVIPAVDIALLPTVEERDNTRWMTFSFSKTGQPTTSHTIRINITDAPIPSIPTDFQARNCLYPSANGSEEQYRGKRLKYERECNDQGWQLAFLNQTILDGQRGLLQRAVNSFRNLEHGQRSRRMKRKEKFENGTLQKRKGRNEMMNILRIGRKRDNMAGSGAEQTWRQDTQQKKQRQCAEYEDLAEEDEDEDVIVSKAQAGNRVALKWKQILVPPLDGSSQELTNLLETDPATSLENTPPPEMPEPESPSNSGRDLILPTSIQVTDAIATTSSPTATNTTLEFQGYINGAFEQVQIVVSVDQAMAVESMDFEFKKRNCVYLRSFLANRHESPHWNTFGIRQAEESYLNEIGWKLCWLNQKLLDGKKVLLQQALDAYRHRFLPLTAQPRAKIGLGLLKTIPTTATSRRKSLPSLSTTAPFPPGQLVNSVEEEEEEVEQGEEDDGEASGPTLKKSASMPKRSGPRVRFNVQAEGFAKESDDDDAGEEGDDNLYSDVQDEEDEEADDNDDEEESGEGSSSEDVYHSQMSLLSFTGAIQTYSLGTGSGGSAARSRPRVTSAPPGPGPGPRGVTAPGKTSSTCSSGQQGYAPSHKRALNDRVSTAPGHNTSKRIRRALENSGSAVRTRNNANTDRGPGDSRNGIEEEEEEEEAENMAEDMAEDGGDTIPTNLGSDMQEDEDDWWMSRLNNSHHPKDHHFVSMTTEELIGALTSGYDSDDDDEDQDDDDDDNGSGGGDEGESEGEAEGEGDDDY